MSRQGAGTSVPAPLAYSGGCAGVVCGVAGVAGAVGPGHWAGLLGVLVGGGLSALFVAPTDLRPPRGLPARSPSAPRDSLGASARCPALPPTGTAAGLADLLLVAPLVFRAPDGPAAREARRPHFVRRRASKPARALRSLRRPPHRRGLSLCVARPVPPPPTGTAAWPSPLRRTRI